MSSAAVLLFVCAAPVSAAVALTRRAAVDLESVALQAELQAWARGGADR